ncbi:hypothetical protein Tco_0557285 [Tanacetum coccineum]
MGRDTIQLETAVSTISSEEFTSEYGIAEELHPKLPSPGERIVDFSEDERVFPTVVDWRISALKDEMPVAGSYSSEDVVVLNTCRTPIQKQPEALLCLVGLSRRYFLGDDVYPTFLNDDDQEMDLFNLMSAPNPTKVKTGIGPRAAHEIRPVESLKVTEQKTKAMRLLPLESPHKKTCQPWGVTPEIGLEKEVAAMGPLVSKKRRERGGDGADENAPPKVLRKDHAAFRPTQSTIEERLTRLDTGSTLSAPTLQETPADVSDPDPLSYAKLQSILEREIAQSSKGATVAGDPDSEKSTSFTSFTRSPSVPSGYFLELRHLRNEDFLNQYNMNLARQVPKRDQRIQAREEEIKKLDQEIHSLKSADTEVQGLRNQTKNLETLLEAEVDMKKAAEAKNVELAEELESLRAKFSDLQVNNTQLSQQVSSLQAQITSEERIKAAFKEFKSAESPEIRQAFDNVVSAGLAKGMSEGLKYGIEYGKAGRDLVDVKAYDPEANDKFVKTLQDLKELKYPILDQLERKKDSPIDLIMAFLHLESDTGEDAPQWIRDLRPSSSQLKIHIYPEVCDPKDPWAVKEEISLEDAIAANISQAEKKKKCRVVCRTHSVGSSHHARSDGVAVSVSTAAPQGLAILLTDAATQKEGSEGEVSLRLIRSKSLPPMFNSEWP